MTREKTSWQQNFAYCLDNVFFGGKNMDWKFWIVDVGIPVATFIIGLFTGRAIEKKASANINGNNNTVVQNSNYENKQG